MDTRAKPKIHHILPGKWKVRGSFKNNARVDLIEKDAVLPLSRRSLDSMRRLHEMAHVKWTPSNLEEAALKATGSKIDGETIHLLEDNRINRALHVKKMPVWDMVGKLYIEELSNSLDCFNDLEKAVAYLAFSGSDKPYIDKVRKKILKNMSGYDIALLNAAEEVIREAGCETALALNEEESWAEFKKTMAVAKVITEWFGKDKGESKKKVKEEDKVADEEVKKSLEGQLTLRAIEAMQERLKGGLPAVQVVQRKIKWGPMKIVRPPLEPRPHTRKKTLKNRPSDTGIVMKHPHRLLTDSRVFTSKYKKQGGTLLIDVSGSMTVTEYQLDKLLDTAPLLTVALYTSDFYSYFSGMLVIVADRERRCNRKQLVKYTGYGNVVDGPALKWLARQEHPRIWVSDGIVTGMGDLNNPELSQEAYAIARNANILRIPDLSTAIKWFEHKAVISSKKFIIQ